MTKQTDIKELHWLMGMLHTINVGLIVIDKEFNVCLWNNFMSNRSGISGSEAMGKNIFNVFTNLPTEWLKRKINSVLMLETSAFTTWEQRPYLFKFKNFRPITGACEHMYQDITFMPLLSVDGTVSHIGIIVYDVTDIAVSKIDLEKANNELAHLSRTDRLTQLNNRGYWEECLALEFARVKRTHQPSTLIMFDIDHFKKINDSYGHQAGDEVIRQTSANLLRTIRKTDFAGRYGGEEFGVVLVNTPADNAMILAERLRKRMQALVVNHDGVEIKYTISLGVAEVTGDIQTYKEWLECSDQALYHSKKNGRNQSTVYSKEQQKKAG